MSYKGHSLFHLHWYQPWCQRAQGTSHCVMSIAYSGGEWTEFNPPAIWSRRQRAQLYGYNDIAVGRPNLLHMTAHLMSYPIYTVQVHCQLLSHIAGLQQNQHAKKSVANGSSGSNSFSCHETCAACEHEMLGYQLDLSIKPDSVVCSLVTCLQCLLVSFQIFYSICVSHQFSI